VTSLTLSLLPTDCCECDSINSILRRRGRDHVQEDSELRPEGTYVFLHLASWFTSVHFSFAGFCYRDFQGAIRLGAPFFAFPAFFASSHRALGQPRDRTANCCSLLIRPPLVGAPAAEHISTLTSPRSDQLSARGRKTLFEQIPQWNQSVMVTPSRCSPLRTTSPKSSRDRACPFGQLCPEPGPPEEPPWSTVLSPRKVCAHRERHEQSKCTSALLLA
jgi:hypothetical protein